MPNEKANAPWLWLCRGQELTFAPWDWKISGNHRRSAKQTGGFSLPAIDGVAK
jgi:hypothetical protein